MMHARPSVNSQCPGQHRAECCCIPTGSSSPPSSLSLNETERHKPSVQSHPAGRWGSKTQPQSDSKPCPKSYKDKPDSPQPGSPCPAADRHGESNDGGNAGERLKRSKHGAVRKNSSHPVQSANPISTHGTVTSHRTFSLYICLSFFTFKIGTMALCEIKSNCQM